MERSRILVADDEPSLRRVLGALLARQGHQVLTAHDGKEALTLASAEGGVDVIVTDLKMPGIDGMELLRRTQLDHPDVPVILITAHGSVENAVTAVKLGAFDYIEKPFENDQILAVVDKALRQRAASKRDARVEPAGPDRGGGRRLIGESDGIRQIHQIIAKVADTPSTVLITGESGTGKELVAKGLHEQGARSKGPFIKINCAAIPKTLMESELFGYEKGAFTGAVGSKPGRFELADGGTLFLDEIGEIPVEMQVKLLRVLQESEFERVGGVRTIKVDVRLVTATNRDLLKEIEVGAFREDLYYRLNVVPIHLPPLRSRPDDIPILVQHFLGRFNERLKKSITGIEQEALVCLRAYPWPGNIRELENVLERMVLFAEGPILRHADLPPELLAAHGAPGHGPLHTPPVHGTLGAGPATYSTPAHGIPAPAFADSHGTEPPASSLKEAVRVETERVEREIIQRALEDTGGNVTQAAKKLKISRKSLQTKMKQFGLRDRDA